MTVVLSRDVSMRIDETEVITPCITLVCLFTTTTWITMTTARVRTPWSFSVRVVIDTPSLCDETTIIWSATSWLSTNAAVTAESTVSLTVVTLFSCSTVTISLQNASHSSHVIEGIPCIRVPWPMFEMSSSAMLLNTIISSFSLIISTWTS